MKTLPLALILSLATPAAAEGPLANRVAATLGKAPTGTRFGLLVTDDTGRELIAIDPDGRYIPASNTKMVTTATAFATLPNLDQADATGGASVRLDGSDVILTGHGDARLSSAPDCSTDCLATLADAVAGKTCTVRDVIGDDSLFPDQRWSPGMSWNNLPTRSGTATSALTLDDNELALVVTATTLGAPPTVSPSRYYALDNRAVTTASGPTTLEIDRAPGGTLLRLSGTIALGATPERLRLGVDDPAHHAAWVFRQMLEARGVRVTGTVAARHRPATPADDPAIRGATPPPRPPEAEPLARLTPPPLIEDLRRTNKVSQNLHAELFLRRIGLQQGTGSLADGLAQVRTILATAGLPRTTYDFSDGSGMSTYNRIAPRGAVTLLRWIAAQPWGAAWRDTLPVGGVDGTLAKRFAGTPLDRKLFAKTGSLNATSALAGYMTAASGRTLTFALYANDVPDGTSATAAMDAALVQIAAAN